MDPVTGKGCRQQGLCILHYKGGGRFGRFATCRSITVRSTLHHVDHGQLPLDAITYLALGLSNLHSGEPGVLGVCTGTLSGTQVRTCIPRHVRGQQAISALLMSSNLCQCQHVLPCSQMELHTLPQIGVVKRHLIPPQKLRNGCAHVRAVCEDFHGAVPGVDCMEQRPSLSALGCLLVLAEHGEA